MYIEGFGMMTYRKTPWYRKARTYVYAAVLFASFQAGQYYNATRQLDAVGLPVDNSEVRDLGYVAPFDGVLKVGML